MPITDQGMSGKPGGDTGNPGIAVPPPPLKKPKGKKGEIKLQTPSKKLKDIVELDPPLKEGKESHHVFTFGRMNPPTTGHEKLIHKTHAIAKSKGAKAHVVLSHSHDKDKNPLPQDKKMHYVSKIHNGVNVTGSSKEHPTFMHHAKKAHADGHTHLHMVAGSDRVKEYQKTLDKYNGHPDHYNFKSITVHSAGHRDPDGHGVSGISGTKMRDHARSGDHKSFKAGLPKSLHAHHKDIAGHIKEGAEWAELEEWVDNLTDFELDEAVNEDYMVEELINERVYTLMQRRKAAIKMRRLKYRVQRMRKLKRKRMATADMLKRRARRQARNLMRKRIAGPKGANYNALSPSEKMQIDKRIQQKLPIINKLAKRLMPKVKSAELIRLRSARSKKESWINSSFGSFISELYNEGTSEDNNRWSFQEYINQSSAIDESPTNQVFKKLKDKQDAEDEKLDKRQDIAKEKLKIQLAKNKQAEIRREAAEIAQAVDMMIEAIQAIESKADKADIDPDLLMVEYVDGYQNPHGKQTPEQGGFAAINRKIAEMSAAEKDKAEDIVKGMKKKASYFKKKYGEKADSVMYATANKLAQESLKDWFGKGKKGDWVRVGTDGKIKGDCAREEGEGKPKCMPRSKAHSMPKKERASAARRKRAADPVADRPGKGGKPIMVKTQVKELYPSHNTGTIDMDANATPAQKKARADHAKKRDAFDKKYPGASTSEKMFAKLSKDRKNPKKSFKSPYKESVQPSGKATKPYSSHGIPKDATKSELKAIRSNPNSSKGKKQLAHWKLNMHKEDYSAMKDAQAHAKRDGANYNRDVSVQHKYDAYHMKKRGYTHRKYNSYGSYEYNKHGIGNKITSADHHGISESVDFFFEGLIAEKSKPNNPKLWAAKKAAAKAKFDVYPSAYANGWAAKQYKAAGGTWRSASESVEEGITTGMMVAKAVGPALAKAAAAKAAPYAAGAAAAYGAGKLAKHKLKKRRDQKMINKAVDQAVAKYHDTHVNAQDHAHAHEAVGAAYMPDAGAVGTPEREITSKAVLKQMNRNRNKEKMKDKVETPKVRYVQDRDKSTDLIKTDRKSQKRGLESKKDQRKKGDTHDKIKKTNKRKKKNVEESTYDLWFSEGGNAGWERFRKREKQGKHLRKAVMKARDDEDNKSHQFKKFGDVEDKEKGKKEVKEDRTAKMTQLFRMGLAKKGELELMKRAMKRGPDALKDPKLRGKLYELLDKLVDLITDKENSQIFVRLRQHVQNNKAELQAAEEALQFDNALQIFEVNKRFEALSEMINTLDEDMSGMSVSSGHKRSVDQGAGMTKKGVAAYRRRNPGSKLQTAVTTPPSKLKAGSKAAKRRKAFCSRSKSWTGERGKAARRRWNC